MKVKQVIDRKNFSRRIPIEWTVIYILLVKEFRLLSTVTGGIIFGITCMFILLLWVIYFIDVIKNKELPVDIFNQEQNPKKNKNNAVEKI